jgi:hypothetical protein
MQAAFALYIFASMSTIRSYLSWIRSPLAGRRGASGALSDLAGQSTTFVEKYVTMPINTRSNPLLVDVSATGMPEEHG